MILNTPHPPLPPCPLPPSLPLHPYPILTETRMSGVKATPISSTYPHSPPPTPSIHFKHLRASSKSTARRRRTDEMRSSPLKTGRVTVADIRYPYQMDRKPTHFPLPTKNYRPASNVRISRGTGKLDRRKQPIRSPPRTFRSKALGVKNRRALRGNRSCAGALRTQKLPPSTYFYLEPRVFKVVVLSQGAG